MGKKARITKWSMQELKADQSKSREVVEKRLLDLTTKGMEWIIVNG